MNPIDPARPASDFVLPATFTIRLTMLSDWHAGTGSGRPGNVDRLVVRDDDGFPFVPSRTVRGIWRDASERLARALDDGRPGDWSRLVDDIFGSQPALAGDDPSGRHADPSVVPLKSRLQVAPALLIDPVRKTLGADQRLLQAATFIKPGVRIDRRTGQAEEDHLRFEEAARVHAVLDAGCVLDIRDTVSKTAASALLVAATRLIERIGGKRRRGRGRCSVEILASDGRSAIDPSLAVAWLEANSTAPAPRKPAPSDDVAQPPPASSDQADEADGAAPSAPIEPAAAPGPEPEPGEWVCIPLVLRLQGPLAVSHRTVGNVVETLDFLPGTYLLPHVIGVLGQLGVDAAGAALRGALCVLPATLQIDGDRGRPVPMVFHAPKDGEGFAEPGRLVNGLIDADEADHQRKQIRVGYLGPGDPASSPRHHQLTPVLRTHNTIEDGPQRPTEKVGGVYSYEAIPPRHGNQPTVLRSELRLRKSLADRLTLRDPAWTAQLAGSLRLGRSRKDDYGAVALEIEPAHDGPQQLPTPQAAGEELIVWLLSDTLLRDERMRPATTASALATALAAKFSADPGDELVLTPRTDPKGCVSRRLDEAIRTRRLDTWHVGWGLPRPSLVGLQAGSCAVFTVSSGAIDAAKLRDVALAGIGERTAEGYGQVCFNDPLLVEHPNTWKTPDRQLPKDPRPAEPAAEPPPPIPAGQPGQLFVHAIEREVWRAEIRRAALRLAVSSDGRGELLRWSPDQDKPPMSQLGALRNAVALLQAPVDARRVTEWLEHLNKVPRRADKWTNNAIRQVRRLLSEPELVWTELQAAEKWPKIHKDAAAALKEELWPLAIRVLIDACVRAHKRALDRMRKPQTSGAAHGA